MAAPEQTASDAPSQSSAPVKGRRASATGAVQQQRIEWGKEWGAIGAAAGKQARGEA